MSKDREQPERSHLRDDLAVSRNSVRLYACAYAGDTHSCLVPLGWWGPQHRRHPQPGRQQTGLGRFFSLQRSSLCSAHATQSLERGKVMWCMEDVDQDLV